MLELSLLGIFELVAGGFKYKHEYMVIIMDPGPLGQKSFFLMKKTKYITYFPIIFEFSRIKLTRKLLLCKLY